MTLTPILLLAGLLLLLYGAASLSTAQVAASRRLRQHSRLYAIVSIVAGAGLVTYGITALLGRG